MLLNLYEKSKYINLLCGRSSINKSTVISPIVVSMTTDMVLWADYNLNGKNYLKRNIQ